MKAFKAGVHGVLRVSAYGCETTGELLCAILRVSSLTVSLQSAAQLPLAENQRLLVVVGDRCCITRVCYAILRNVFCMVFMKSVWIKSRLRACFELSFQFCGCDGGEYISAFIVCKFSFV